MTSCDKCRGSGSIAYPRVERGYKFTSCPYCDAGRKHAEQEHARLCDERRVEHQLRLMEKGEYLPWRPIVDAPHDGRPVLLWLSTSGEPIIGVWLHDGWRHYQKQETVLQIMPTYFCSISGPA